MAYTLWQQHPGPGLKAQAHVHSNIRVWCPHGAERPCSATIETVPSNLVLPAGAPRVLCAQGSGHGQIIWLGGRNLAGHLAGHLARRCETALSAKLFELRTLKSTVRHVGPRVLGSVSFL